MYRYEYVCPPNPHRWVWVDACLALAWLITAQHQHLTGTLVQYHLILEGYSTIPQYSTVHCHLTGTVPCHSGTVP